MATDDSDADDDDSFTVLTTTVTKFSSLLHGGSNMLLQLQLTDLSSSYNSSGSPQKQLQELMVHLLLVLMEHTLTLQINQRCR
jgi:hypothetical protein